MNVNINQVHDSKHASSHLHVIFTLMLLFIFTYRYMCINMYKFAYIVHVHSTGTCSRFLLDHVFMFMFMFKCTRTVCLCKCTVVKETKLKKSFLQIQPSDVEIKKNNYRFICHIFVTCQKGLKSLGRKWVVFATTLEGPWN